MRPPECLLTQEETLKATILLNISIALGVDEIGVKELLPPLYRHVNDAWSGGCNDGERSHKDLLTLHFITNINLLLEGSHQAHQYSPHRGNQRSS